MMSETNQNEYNLLDPVAKPEAYGTGVRWGTGRPQLNMFLLHKNQIRKANLFNGVTIISKFASLIKKNQS
jgi:hypothetical protein